MIAVKNLSAPQLVPLLRPMIPQAGHLSAVPGTNSLVIIDRFANVRRIEGVIRTLDTTEASKTRTDALQKGPADTATGH